MHASLPDEAFAFHGAVVALARIRDTSEVAYAAVLGAALCCYAALGAVLSIAPREVIDHLGGGATEAGLAVGAPALTGLLSRPLGGRLADRVKPRLLRLAGPGRRGRVLGHIGLANYG